MPIQVYMAQKTSKNREAKTHDLKSRSLLHATAVTAGFSARLARCATFLVAVPAPHIGTSSMLGSWVAHALSPEMPSRPVPMWFWA